MWVSTLSSNGFVRWKWVENIICYVPICVINIILFCYVVFLHRTGHGIATCQPTSTWTPTSISSCPVFCSKLGKDASSSPASTPTSAQCKSTCRLTCTSALTHWHYVCNESSCNKSIATLQERHVNGLGKHFVSLEVPKNSLIFGFPWFPQGSSQAEQISHPLPDPGNFWNISRDDGHPLPDHSNRHKFRPEWKYSGELCCIEVKNLSLQKRTDGTWSVQLQLWRDVLMIISVNEYSVSSSWVWAWYQGATI